MSRSQFSAENEVILDRAWAIFVVRVLLGIVFFIAGIYKVFMLGAIEHARTLFVERYADTYLPMWGLWATGTVIPFLELIAGGLVLIGLWTRPSLYVLGAILVLVAFGHLVLQPATALNAFVLPRSAMLLFVLMLPSEADLFSIDHVLASRRIA